MRSVLAGSYETPFPNAVMHGGVALLSSPEQPHGMTSMVRCRDGAVVCCYGDRLFPAVSEPETANAREWLAWSREAMLRGCGAICQRDALFLWVDEAASCPLFYAFDSAGQPVFATRAALIAEILPDSRRFVFPEQGRPLPPPGKTIFRGVRAVQPGTMLRFERARGHWSLREESCYFELPSPHISDSGEAQSRVAWALTQSVRRAVAGLDEVAVTLSGGVDSSSVAALAAQSGKRLSTYTIGSPFGNEFEPAAEVARWLHSRHHEMVMTPEDLQTLLPGLVAALETWDPVTLQIAAPVAYLYRQLAAPGTVVLTGYGADLIFAGVADASLPEEPLECEILAAVRRTVLTNEFSPAYAADHGVTVRYPFWSPAMLSTALSIRARLKVRDGAVKHVFRKAAEAWVPREVAWRSKLGIHEGSAMHHMFDECLGVRGLAAQSRALHEIAGRVLLPSGAQRRAGQESAICASS